MYVLVNTNARLGWTGYQSSHLPSPKCLDSFERRPLPLAEDCVWSKADGKF
jgi:hypothetical protein